MGPVSLDRSWLLLPTDLGVNVENVFRRAGLPLDLQARESVKLGFEQYVALYAALEAEADDPLLPIRIAESISSEAFHPAIFGALCSPNLVTALRRLAEYKSLVAPMVVQLEDDARGLFVGVSWQDPSATMTPSMAATEMTLASVRASASCPCGSRARGHWSPRPRTRTSLASRRRWVPATA